MNDRHIPDGYELVKNGPVITAEQILARQPNEMRVSGRSTLHFENGGDSVVSFDATMAFVGQKPKHRAVMESFTVGEAWEELQFGYFQNAVMIALSNVTGRQLTTNPTLAQVEAHAKAVIELKLPQGDTLLVRPKTYTVLQPTGRIEIRSQCGEASFLLFAVPEAK